MLKIGDQVSHAQSSLTDIVDASVIDPDGKQKVRLKEADKWFMGEDCEWTNVNLTTTED